MNKCFLSFLFCFSLSVLNANGQYSKNGLDYAETYIKVWGLAKYASPNPAYNFIDYDSIFIHNIEKVLTCRSKRQFCQLVDDLIIEYHYDKDLNGTAPYLSKRYPLKNSNLKTLSKSTIQRINRQLYWTHIKPSNIDFTKGVGSPIFIENEHLTPFPDLSLRLLGLARYWNAIYYFYPYFRFIDNSDFYNLGDHIKTLINLRDVEDYHVFWYTRFMSLNDLHGQCNSFILDNHFGVYFLPFKIRIIEETPIIWNVHQDYKDKFKRGDILIGTSTYSLDSTWTFSIGNRSNLNNATQRSLVQKKLRSNKKTEKVTVSRSNVLLEIETKTISTNEYLDITPERLNSFSKDSFAYFDFCNNESISIRPFLIKNSGKKYLIFDLRGGTNWYKETISELLFSGQLPFAKIIEMNPYDKPSYPYTRELKIGNSSESSFDGNLILLVNEFTQSRGEFQAMYLQAYPKSFTIGSPTAGADGNVSDLSIPGGIELRFSGIGVRYPDETPTQVSGIKLDANFKIELEDLFKVNDPLLNYIVSQIEEKGWADDRPNF